MEQRSWQQAATSMAEKYSSSKLVIDAYEMMVDVASEEGRVEKNDDLRRKFFNLRDVRIFFG